MSNIGDFNGNFTKRMRGESQVISVEGGFDEVVYGDVTGNLLDRSSGGNDTITALARSITVYGDAGGRIDDFARGGNDTISAGGRFGSVFGDAQSMAGRSRGGDDHVTARFQAGTVYGDAFSMEDRARGGDDVLISRAQPAQLSFDITTLYGDAQTMSGRTRGGDDALVSGAGTDHMWGDAAQMLDRARGGEDTFVFAGQFGNDRIFDFRPDEGDRLSIDVADPDAEGAEVTLAVSGSDLVVTVAEGTISSGTITLVGFTGALNHDDLILV